MPQKQVEGRNLLPLLKDKDAEWSDRFLFTHQGRWPTGAEPNKFQWKNFAVRNQRFRLVNNDALYDIQEDPGQTINVFDEHPEIVREMREAYEAWWTKTRPMMVNESAPMSPTRPFHELYREQLKTVGIPAWEPPKI